MYKTLGGIAAAAMLVMVAAPGAAAAQRQETGIHKQAVDARHQAGHDEDG